MRTTNTIINNKFKYTKNNTNINNNGNSITLNLGTIINLIIMQ